MEHTLRDPSIWQEQGLAVPPTCGIAVKRLKTTRKWVKGLQKPTRLYI